MSLPKLLIIGAGGHGRSVAEAAALQQRHQVFGFVDDGCAVGMLVLGKPVLGSITDLPRLAVQVDAVVVAIGNNTVRERLVEQLARYGVSLATVVHPFSWVSPSAVLGPGCAVMAGAVVGTEAKLGIAVIVNAGAVVDHHAVVNDYGHLGVGACMAGGSVLGRSSWLQAGCALGYGVVVESGTTLLPGRSLPSA